jgi:hypothetical protein
MIPSRYVTDHYNILEDVSNLFKALIFFETDDDRWVGSALSLKTFPFLTVVSAF